MFNYKELTSRHSEIFKIIDYDLIKKIKKTRLAFAGCGLGGNIAILAARSGFINFTLIDNDCIEISNLNRQPFSVKDVGKNKVDIIEKEIKLINPLVKIKKYNEKIEKDVNKFFTESDIIINTIDLDDQFYNLCRIGKNSDKSVIVPMNLPFGAFSIIFSKKTPQTLFDLKIKKEIEFLIFFLTKNKTFNIPDYLRIFEKKIRKSKIKYNPQSGLGANITSALVINLILGIISEKKVDVAPKFYFIDLFINPS